MRYSEIDLLIEDIMWFAVDKMDRVLAFTSGDSETFRNLFAVAKRKRNGSRRSLWRNWTSLRKERS